MAFRKKKVDYYSIRGLLKGYPEAKYYMAVGERSNGKTYSALEYALERYYSNGEQFAYVRRFAEDIRPKHMSQLLSGHVNNGIIDKLSNGQFINVEYISGKFFPYIFDSDKQEKTRQEEPIGYAFDLNSSEHFKSTSFPKVTTIIFDEFLSRRGYLPGEFILFMNIISTIVRDRSNVKIIMLGNTVNKYCPYFAEMGLSHVKDQKPGTIDVYNYGVSGLQVVFEYCDPLAKKGGKPSDIYFAFDNPQLQMITAGAWEIAIYPHLTTKYRPKDVVTNFFVEFDDELLHGEVICTDCDYYIFLHPKTTPIKDDSKDIVYTNRPCQKWNYKLGFAGHTDALTRHIKRMLVENAIYYSDNETGEIFRNYLEWANQYSVARGV